MSTNQVQRDGAVINYTLTGTVAAGAVVPLQHAVGVALKGGVSGDVIPLAIEGVFTVPKVAGAAWVVGEKLVYDASLTTIGGSGVTLASGDLTGVAIAVDAAASADTTGVAKLTPGNVTRT